LKKVLHFIFDVFKIYAAGFIALTLIIIAATVLRLICTNQDTAEQWSKAMNLIAWFQLSFAPFGIIFAFVTVIADRNKIKDDKKYGKFGFMRRIISIYCDENETS
jgi:hypothetical protein